MKNIDDPCEDWDEDEEHANPVPDWEGKIRLEESDGEKQSAR